jgi:hypothetical protein
MIIETLDDVSGGYFVTSLIAVDIVLVHIGGFCDVRNGATSA